MNNNEIIRATCVKYHFENDLKFDTHIKKLETDLSKSVGPFYKIRSFLNICTFKTLYYSLVYFKLHYGIIAWPVWRTANKTSLHNLSIIVNKIIRSIAYNSKFRKISKVHKQQSLLKIPEIYELDLGKLMYKIHNGFVPTAVEEEFIASTSVYNHNTRLQKKGNYYLQCAKT